MVDVDSKIPGFWARVFRAGARSRQPRCCSLGPRPWAREPGTEQQRIAYTPDLLRLFSWELPNVDRIVACLRREKISAECRLPSGVRDRRDRITRGPQQQRRDA